MTFQEKQLALLADLVKEKVEFGPRWDCYYDGKIAEMIAAIEVENGSGTGDQTGRSAGVPDVPGGAAQTL